MVDRTCQDELSASTNWNSFPCMIKNQTRIGFHEQRATFDNVMLRSTLFSSVTCYLDGRRLTL
jgi:hypothetical protein